LVKPNRRELEIWAGRPLPELCDVVEAAHALRDPEGFLTQAIAQAKPYQAVAPAATVTLATGPKRIVAITACPTGVAHTFMAAEAIESEAKKRGWWVKVETRGSVGAGNQY
jgi:fructose-specific phosphotransferase system component IIB